MKDEPQERYVIRTTAQAQALIHKTIYQAEALIYYPKEEEE